VRVGGGGMAEWSEALDPGSSVCTAILASLEAAAWSWWSRGTAYKPKKKPEPPHCQRELQTSDKLTTARSTTCAKEASPT
jgi:hypothetical protein